MLARSVRTNVYWSYMYYQSTVFALLLCTCLIMSISGKNIAVLGVILQQFYIVQTTITQRHACYAWVNAVEFTSIITAKGEVTLYPVVAPSPTTIFIRITASS